MNILIATVKSWNVENARRFRKSHPEHRVRIISDRKDLTAAALSRFKPHWVFFPHWSWIIPHAIYGSYRCVVFHMTDLPYGRGGSPLQNLIVRGHKHTKISAIHVIERLDAGPVYLKRRLSLSGSAGEILRRASRMIFSSMIPHLLKGNTVPKAQQGEGVVFTRRTPDDGNIGSLNDIATVYDYIRMLDGEGYPRAFLAHGDLLIEFSEAALKGDVLTARADVTIGRRGTTK